MCGIVFLAFMLLICFVLYGPFVAGIALIVGIIGGVFAGGALFAVEETQKSAAAKRSQKAQKRVDRAKRTMGEVEGVEYDAQYYEKQRRLMESDTTEEPDQIAPTPPRRPSSFRRPPKTPQTRKKP